MTMTATTELQLGEDSELKCSESVTTLSTSNSNGGKPDEEMESKVVTVEGTAECTKSTSEIDIDKVNIEGDEEGKEEEDAVAVPTEMEVEPSKEGNIDSGNDNLSTGGDNVAPDDGVVNGSKEESAPDMDIHQQQEAELKEFLESLKPKPKRKSIKEMIMAMPGYKDISTLKPKIGGNVKKDKKDVIILDDEVGPRRLSKRQQEIEVLKDRFVMHALVPPPKPLKEEHIMLKIKKKEEDSQGIEHLVENEVEYIRNPLNEEDEAMSTTPGSLGTSPQSDKPGAKYCSLRHKLLGQIRMKKLKLYEERVKLNAADNEEGDDEEASDKEEFLEDDAANSEDDSDDDNGDSDLGEEEEELEDLLSGPGAGKKNKNAYIDDEAEEDGDDEDDEEDEDDSDDESNEKDKPGRDSKLKTTNTAELESIGDSRDSNLITPTVPDSPTNKQEESTSINQSENENSASMDFGIDLTPKVSATVLNPATPSDFWIPAKTSINSRHADGLSPLIPRINRKTEFVELEKETTVNAHTSVPDSLANVISESENKFDDLVGLCSGKFVTQQPEASGIQDDDDEFGNFDFGDDDFCEDNKTGENSECVKTPVAGSTRNAVDGITPKLAAKPTIARRSMQFEMEAVAEDEAGKSDKTGNSKIGRVNLDDEDDDEVVTRRSIKKNKRLQFSDDEEDGKDETPASIPASEDEQSDVEEEVVQMEVEPEPAKVDNPFFNKHGKLKRKFVEDEAELSGSDEGSGDEDERGLNDYEMEEGDDEELDESEVKDQVGRVHMKITLDDDDRQILYLQNKYVEDGDLGGDIREQKFRFFDKNALTDDARMGDSDEEEQEETSEERLKRDEWIEKRKWISENSHLLENDADESQSLLTSTKIGKQTLKRIESFVDTSTSESKDFHFKETSSSIKRNSIWEKILETRKATTKTPASGSNSLTACSEVLNFGSVGNDTVDESSKSMSEPMFGGMMWTKSITAVGTKGSFLSRGGTMLAKLAEATKPGDTVSNVKNNSRNFVFSHITPPNIEKTDGSTSRVKRAINRGSCKVQAKKIKVDRSFHNLDETSKQSSVFKFL